MELNRYIKIYDNVIPVETIANIIKVGNTINFEPGGIDEGQIDKTLRSVNLKNLTNLSDSMTIVHWYNYLYSLLQHYLKEYNKEINHIRGSIVTDIVSIELLKYKKSDEYVYHWDHAMSAPRTLSCTLLLNDDYEGGNLFFKEIEGANEFYLENKPGRLIIWPSNFLYPHCIKPVKKGTRFSIVSWAL
jgi:predicted 2-oxoglutarate/Fe(II)-dependent dioxygenase YbiX